MKRFSFILISLLLAASVARAQAPATTTISDVVYRADGTPAGGTLLLTWPAFESAGGKAVAAGSKSVTLGAGGVVNVALVPNEGANPSGTYYKVVYKLDDGSTSEELWNVPTVSPTTIAAIRSTVVPSGVAIQVASRQYVDTQLAAVTGTRFHNIRYCDQFTGPDAGTKIAACIADLPSTGGVADARGLEGAQTISTDILASVTKPVELRVCGATFTVNAGLTLAGSVSPLRNITIRGCASKAPTFKAGAGSISVFKLGAFAELENLIIDDGGFTSVVGVERSGVLGSSNSVTRNLQITLSSATNIGEKWTGVSPSGVFFAISDHTRITGTCNYGVFIQTTAAGANWVNQNQFPSLQVRCGSTSGVHIDGGDSNYFPGLDVEGIPGTAVRIVDGQGTRIMGCFMQSNTKGNLFLARNGNINSGTYVACTGLQKWALAVNTTGSITTGTPTLTVASASNIEPGKILAVAGAGPAGAILYSEVIAVSGVTVTLAGNASTTVAGAAVGGPELDAPLSATVMDEQYQSSFYPFLWNPALSGGMTFGALPRSSSAFVDFQSGVTSLAWRDSGFNTRLTYAPATGAASFGGAVTSPNFISSAADPADGGVLRLANGEPICVEALPAGTDGCFTFNPSGQFDFGANPILTTGGGDFGTLSNRSGGEHRWYDPDNSHYFGVKQTQNLTANYVPEWNVTGNCSSLTNGGALTINSLNQIVCEADDGGSGDAIEIEQGDNTGVFDPIDTTARFDDSGDINFAFTDGVAGGPDTVTATVRADSVALITDTTGNFVASLSSGAGLTGFPAAGEGATGAPALSYADTLAGDPAMNAEECRFSTDGTGGGLICEGTTADAFEGMVAFPFTGSDKTITFFDATDTVVGRSTSDTLANKVLNNSNSFSGFTDWTAIAAPATPAAGIGRLFFQSSNKMFCGKDDAGVVTCMDAGAGGGNEFNDDVFRVRDQTDTTKKVALEVSGVTTATTRTWTVQNANITVAGLNLAQNFTADQTFDTNILVRGTIKGDSPGASGHVRFGVTLAGGVYIFEDSGGVAQAYIRPGSGANLFDCDPGATQRTCLLLNMPQPGVAGQRDSHFLDLTGTSFDTGGHDADWRQFVDVTSNAAASTYTIQSRIDAAAFANRFRIPDGADIQVPAATDTLVGKATTDTLTNKTLDAEATGNALGTVGVIWIDGAGCNNTTALENWDSLASGQAVSTCNLGTNTAQGVLRFATDSGTLTKQRKFLLPHDWNSAGNVDARVKWKTAAIVNDVVWQIAIACVGDGETDDPAFTDDVFTADTAKGTANQQNDTVVNTVTTTGTCAAGELAYVRIKRDPANAGDTLAAGTNADLIGLEIRYRRTQ